MIGGLSIYDPEINGNPCLGVCLYNYRLRINGNPWLGVCLYMVPGSMVWGLSIYGLRINGNPWLGVCLYMASGSMEIHGLGSLGMAAIHILAVHAQELTHKEINITIIRDSEKKSYTQCGV